MTTSPTTVADRSALEAINGFYVPRVRVRVGDTEVEGIRSLVYDDSVNDEQNALDRFELTVSNWDPDERRHRYIGSESSAELDGPRGAELKMFEPSTTAVTVELGYGGDLQLFMVGLITNMQPAFPAGGAPTLKASGVNTLYRLRDKQRTWAWENKTDSEIAKDLATNPRGSQGKFPYTVHVRTDASTAEKPLTYLAERNQYDIDFLFRRARENGYTIIAFDVKPKGGKGKPATHLWFGPAERFPADLPADVRERRDESSVQTAAGAAGDVSYRLAWGQSLIDVNPTISTRHQLHSVTVNGWDRRKKKAFSETVKYDDKELKLPKELQRIVAQTPETSETISDEPVFSKDQAKRKALGAMRNQQKVMVTAKGTTVGLPELRAGRHVELAELGARLSGTYLVTATTHTFDEAGYTTKFTARLETGAR